MHSCIYRGVVRHRRFVPVEHAFQYRMCMLYLDLDEFDEVFRGRWLWSTRGFNFAWFNRADYHGDAEKPLREAVADTVAEQTGRRPTGPIRVLTHPRYLGYVFNPVSFYYCFEEDGETLAAMMAEITNTPWNERHAYVLDSRANGKDSSTHFHYRFDKTFHISPFMEMDHAYDWQFARPGGQLTVHMTNRREGEAVFDATLTTRREEIGGRSLATALAAYPLMTAQVTAGIYWQALRLKLKRCPFHAHPKNTQSQGIEMP